MNGSQVALILAKAQAFDNRTVGETNIGAWQEALEDVDFEQAMTAVTEHYRDSTDWLMPSHIVKKIADVKFQQRIKLKAAGPCDFPSGLDLKQEAEYRSFWQMYVCRGASRDDATALADANLGYTRLDPVPPSPEMRALIENYRKTRFIPERPAVEA